MWGTSSSYMMCPHAAPKATYVPILLSRKKLSSADIPAARYFSVAETFSRGRGCLIFSQNRKLSAIVPTPRADFFLFWEET
jgi:hypothetical protein